MARTAGARHPMGITTWPTWAGLGLVRVLGALPESWLTALCRGMAWLAYRQNSRQSRAIRINIQACYPALTAGQRGAFHREYLSAFFRAILLSPKIWWSRDTTLEQMTRYHGREHLEQALDTGQPVILLVSHTVALDAGLICMSRDYPLQGLYRVFKNPVLESVFYRARTRFGGRLTRREAGLRPALKSLKNGRLLSYFGDEDLGKTDSVFADFFGHQKATLSILPRLIEATGALVIPMASYYNAVDRTIEINLLPALTGLNGENTLPAGDRSVDTMILQAGVINRAIEQTIAICPEQYLWKLRLFKTCPAGNTLSRYLQIERGQLKIEDL